MQDVVLFCTQLLLMACVWCKCCCCCCKLPGGKHGQRRLTAAGEPAYQLSDPSSRVAKDNKKQKKNQRNKKAKALVAIPDADGLYSAVHAEPLVTFRARPTRKALVGIMPVRYPGTDDDPIPYIDDADSDDDNQYSDRNRFDSDDMKKGLKRRLFGDKRRDQDVSDSDGGNSSAVESDAEQRTTTKTSFLQKMFKKGGSSSPAPSPIESPGGSRRHDHQAGAVADDENMALDSTSSALQVDVDRLRNQHASRGRERRLQHSFVLVTGV